MKLEASNKPIIPIIVSELIIVYRSASSALDWLTRLESHVCVTFPNTFR